MNKKNIQKLYNSKIKKLNTLNEFYFDKSKPKVDIIFKEKNGYLQLIDLKML